MVLVGLEMGEMEEEEGRWPTGGVVGVHGVEVGVCGCDAMR